MDETYRLDGLPPEPTRHRSRWEDPAVESRDAASVEIVRAQASDCRRLSAIAWAAKAHWGYPMAWLEAWRRELTFLPHHLEIWDVFAARFEGQLQGVYALSSEGSGAELEHLWVHPRAMGRGLGRSLWDHAVARARKAGARRMEILSDPNAAPFYAHLGAVHVRDSCHPVLGQPRQLPVYEVVLGE